MWWVAGAAIAAVPVVLSFLFTLPFWYRLRPLWQDHIGPRTSSEVFNSEDDIILPLLPALPPQEPLQLLPTPSPSPPSPVIARRKADMDWVAY